MRSRSQGERQEVGFDCLPIAMLFELEFEIALNWSVFFLFFKYVPIAGKCLSGAWAIDRD